MTNFLKYLLFILSIATIVGCKTDYKQIVTYFGGKIINPKTNFVLLYDRDKVIDSLFLDDDNKFMGKYKNFKEGFYCFVHGLEHQYVYIEPKDSILIRLNTWVFDESLVFSGIGAERNNLLIDFFLENEKENKTPTFYSFFYLEPYAFKSKLDSIIALRQKKINAFKRKNPKATKDYLLLLDIAAKYPIYSKFEEYLDIHRSKINTDISIKKDDLFYSYRKNIAMNNDTLIYFGAYSKYVVNRLYNDVYTQGFRGGTEEFIVALLNSIDKNIHKKSLKDTFLKEMLINDFRKNSNCNINDEAFHTFFKLSSNIDDKKMVQRLLNDIKNLRRDNYLTDFEIIDYNQITHGIKKIIKHKNSVIYFWNPKYTSDVYLASRINYLTKQFPEINFIGIKITSNNSTPVKGIDIKNQFYLDQNSKANLFLTSKLPRTLLVNRKGIIINSYASISSPIINKRIIELQLSIK